MKITYDVIQEETKEIINILSVSTEKVPSLFLPIKRLAVPLLTYIVFAIMSYFTLSKSDDSSLFIWMGFLGFGVIHWFFLFSFALGYESIFSMANLTEIKKLRIVRIISKKIKIYGVAWFVFLTILGLLSLLTELNVAALVMGNFVVTIFGIFIFNMDISRYQLAGLFGAASAAKEKFSQ